jgi:hypothetical protein
MEQTMISKSRLLSRSLLCVLIVMLGAVFIHAQTDLTGFWVFKVPRGDGTLSESYFELKQSGETITDLHGRRGDRARIGRWREDSKMKASTPVYA